MTDKLTFFLKLLFLQFMFANIMAIIGCFFFDRDTVAVAYLVVLVILFVNNLLVAIVEEPITRWLM